MRGVAEKRTQPPSERSHLVVQTPLAAVLRSACATGHIALASRFPPLATCPPEVFELFSDEAPAWYEHAADDNEPAPGPWPQRQQVQSVALNSNEITDLDARLGEFAELRHLDLHGNRLSALPPSLADLHQLTTLNLARNDLIEFPACIARLPSLKSLDVSHNRLERLWSADAADAALLPALTTLDLSGNRLATEVLAPMPPSVERLDLSHNALQAPIPLFLFKRCEQLRELSLAHNELGDAVWRLDGTVQALPKLQVLDVRGAQLTSLNVLETAFASTPSVTLSEAKERHRPWAASQLTDASALTQRQLVRVSTRPGASEEQDVRSALAPPSGPAATPLFVLSDVQVRSESHRRRRGGRGRGGEDKVRHRDEHAGEAPTPNAGSALASAKLSTKKKEALGQVPCKFFRNHGCSAGDACPFAHTLPGEGQPKAVCQWYIKGSCRFGHRCALAHILPGQPMSMDRKNKRAAQHGTPPTPKDDAASASHAPESVKEPKHAAPPASSAQAVPMQKRAQSAQSSGAPSGTPEDLASSLSRAGWSADAPSSLGTSQGRPDAFEASAPAAFGTSPFSQPGNPSVFFNTSRTEPSTMPVPAATGMWGGRERVEEPLADSVHGEEFLPSSLSDLLTPAELERRTRSARDTTPSGPSSFTARSYLVSQSLPASGAALGAPKTSPPTLPTSSMRLSSYGGAFPLAGRSHGSRSAASHSMHASPFLPPILDSSLGSPPRLSPTGTGSRGGERIPVPFRSHRSTDDVHHASRVSGSRYTPRSQGLVSPAILPVLDADPDDAIFELE